MMNPIIVKGRYELLQELGTGGVGTTYLGIDKDRLGAECAVKRLTFRSRDPNQVEKVRELFQREAETLAQLGHHRQIPQLLAFFEENQEFYLVQEFIRGETLTQELASGEYTEDDTLEFLEEILHILQFVHKEGVIHRDIKPDNLIRRDEDQKLVLIDFGSVKSLVSQSSNGTQVSTLGYTPPEQMLGDPQFNSDIYALGMTAIQMITGLEPRNLGKSNKGEVSWRDEVKEEFRTQLPAIIDRMVRSDTKRRYQSVDEVLKDVKDAGKTKIAVVSQDNSDRDGNFKLIFGLVLVSIGIVSCVLGFILSPKPVPPDTPVEPEEPFEPQPTPAPPKKDSENKTPDTVKEPEVLEPVKELEVPEPFKEPEPPEPPPKEEPEEKEPEGIWWEPEIPDEPVKELEVPEPVKESEPPPKEESKEKEPEGIWWPPESD